MSIGGGTLFYLVTVTKSLPKILFPTIMQKHLIIIIVTITQVVSSHHLNLSARDALCLYSRCHDNDNIHDDSWEQ